MDFRQDLLILAKSFPDLIQIEQTEWFKGFSKLIGGGDRFAEAAMKRIVNLSQKNGSAPSTIQRVLTHFLLRYATEPKAESAALSRQKFLPPQITAMSLLLKHGGRFIDVCRGEQGVPFRFARNPMIEIKRQRVAKLLEDFLPIASEELQAWEARSSYLSNRAVNFERLADFYLMVTMATHRQLLKEQALLLNAAGYVAGTRRSWTADSLRKALRRFLQREPEFQGTADFYDKVWMPTNELARQENGN